MEHGSSSPTSADPGNSPAFQRWLKKAAVLTGIGITPEERQRGFEDQQHVRCEKWKTELMNYSPSFSPCPRVHAHVFCLRIGVHFAWIRLNATHPTQVRPWCLCSSIFVFPAALYHLRILCVPHAILRVLEGSIRWAQSYYAKTIPAASATWKTP
jgi:hypothetical protein